MTKPVRILVVDDNPEILDLFSEVLRREGYEVQGAPTGTEALAVARAWHPDLVVLDVMLPDLSGTEVCRQIKADPNLTDVFVLLASGTAIDSAHKVGGLEIGADDYLVKPVDLAEFRARIRTLARLQQTTVALRLSRENYRQLVEILPEGIWMVDPLGNLLAANPQAVAMLGHASLEELLQQTIFELAAPEDGARLRAELKRAAEQGVAHDFACTLVRKDGSRFPAEASIAVVSGGEEPARAFVCIVRDVTERRQAERRVRELLHLIDQAHDAIIVRDLAGHIRYFNEGAERLLGWASDEARGRHVVGLLMDDPARFEVAQQILLQTGEWSGELPVRTKAGEPRIVSSRWTLVRGDTDQASYVVVIHTDVTERKQVEETLRRRLDLSQAIIGGSMDGYWLADLEGNILDVNPAYCQMTGFRSEEILAHNISEFDVDETSPGEVQRHMQQIVQAGRDRFETCHRRKDGQIIDVEVSVTHLPAQGVCVAFLRNITERNESQDLVRFQRDAALLLGSAEDLPELLERLLDMVLQVNGVDAGAVYLLTEVTRSFDLVAHRGWPAGFAGRVPRFPVRSRDKSDTELIYRSQGDAAGTTIEPFVREDLRAVEAIPVRLGGELVVWLVAGSRLQPGLPAQSRLVIESVSAQARGAISRLRAESSLRTSQQLLEKTFRSIRSAVLVVNTATDLILECNPAASHIFGYAREEMLGQTTAFLHLDEAGHALSRRHLAAAIHGQAVESDFECRMKRKDGTTFPTENSVTPILDEAGRCLKWVTVVRDFTQRKAVEDELRHIPSRIIEAQESERQRVARELHDGVNQTIASAKMRLQKVQEAITPLNPATKEILARCQRLLVQALEENRRIAQNLRPADLDEFGWAVACRNLCEELRSRTGLEVKCSLTPEIERLPAVVELNLFRMVQEALTNVEKHAHARTVQVRMVLQGNSIILRVRDDGRGFDPKARPAARAKYRGAGLTNIRERAAALGGSCEISATPKRGTLITVRLPYAPAGDSVVPVPRKKPRRK